MKALVRPASRFHEVARGPGFWPYGVCAIVLEFFFRIDLDHALFGAAPPHYMLAMRFAADAASAGAKRSFGFDPVRRRLLVPDVGRAAVPRRG